MEEAIEQRELTEAEQLKEQRYQVTDESGANWCFWKIKQYQYQMAKADQTVEEAKAFAKSEKEKAANQIEFFKGLLAEWADQQDDPKWEFTGPAGRIVYGKATETITKGDEKKLLDQFGGTKYVKKVVKEETKLDWTELKKHLSNVNGKIVTEDGELVEGANLKQREAGWRIKNKPEGAKNWKEI